MTTERSAPLTHGTRTGGRRPTTSAGAGRSRSRRSFGPDRLTVMLFGAAAFLVVLALLAGQLRAASGYRAARPVRVIRRVYQTTVVETLIGSRRGGRAFGGASSVTQSVSSSGSGSALSSAPTTRSS